MEENRIPRQPGSGSLGVGMNDPEVTMSHLPQDTVAECCACPCLLPPFTGAGRCRCLLSLILPRSQTMPLFRPHAIPDNPIVPTS